MEGRGTSSIIVAVLVVIAIVVAGNVFAASRDADTIIFSVPVFVVGLLVVLNGDGLIWVFFGKNKKRYIAIGVILTIIGTLIMLFSFTYGKIA